MNIESTTANDTSDEVSGPSSLPTALPGPPRMPTFMPLIVAASAQRPILTLVCSNPTPSASRATIPNLRVVKSVKTITRPSMPPPSLPPTGSTPIRLAA